MAWCYVVLFWVGEVCVCGCMSEVCWCVGGMMCGLVLVAVLMCLCVSSMVCGLVLCGLVRGR